MARQGQVQACARAARATNVSKHVCTTTAQSRIGAFKWPSCLQPYLDLLMEDELVDGDCWHAERQQHRQEASPACTGAKTYRRVAVDEGWDFT